MRSRICFSDKKLEKTVPMNNEKHFVQDVLDRRRAASFLVAFPEMVTFYNKAVKQP